MVTKEKILVLLVGITIAVLFGLLISTAKASKIIGVTAQCEDGYYTTSNGRGTCAGHGGVKKWIDK